MRFTLCIAVFRDSRHATCVGCFTNSLHVIITDKLCTDAGVTIPDFCRPRRTKLMQFRQSTLNEGRHSYGDKQGCVIYLGKWKEYVLKKLLPSIISKVTKWVNGLCFSIQLTNLNHDCCAKRKQGYKNVLVGIKTLGLFIVYAVVLQSFHELATRTFSFFCCCID